MLVVESASRLQQSVGFTFIGNQRRGVRWFVASSNSSGSLCPVGLSCLQFSGVKMDHGKMLKLWLKEVPRGLTASF